MNTRPWVNISFLSGRGPTGFAMDVEELVDQFLGKQRGSVVSVRNIRVHVIRSLAETWEVTAQSLHDNSAFKRSVGNRIHTVLKGRTDIEFVEGEGWIRLRGDR